MAKISFDSGCTTGEGNVTVEPDTLRVSDLVLTEETCYDRGQLTQGRGRRLGAARYRAHPRAPPVWVGDNAIGSLRAPRTPAGQPGSDEMGQVAARRRADRLSPSAGPIGTFGIMKAVVVYESHWGNTAAIAQAIAEGIGSGTRALNTDEATREALAGVDLIVAGSPVIAFALPRDGSLNQIAKDEKAPVPPDVSHPLLRTWLHNLPVGHGFAAAFETRIWWSLRGATGTIESMLRESGYERLLPGERFTVAGGYGPLRAGEAERARRWGAELAAAMAKQLVPA